MYQKLVDNGKYSHLLVSFIYAIIQVFINVIVYYSYRLNIDLQLAIFAGLVLLFILIYLYLFKKFSIK